MKHFIAFVVALAAVAGTAPAAPAEDFSALARSNCTRYILARTDVTSGTVKGFQLVKTGEGYEMSGLNEDRQRVRCQADAGGRVAWVHVG